MTKPIDLRADLAKIVHEIIVRYLPAGVSVRVFGSRANWTAKSHSDLDLALKGSEKLPGSLIDELAESFSESDLPIRVDVVDWHAVPATLQAVIRRDGVPFTVQLGEIATLLSGGTPSKSNEAFWGGVIPWLTPKDMGHWDGTTQAHVTDASIGKGTRLAPPNAVFVAVRGMSLHNEIRVIRSEKPITFNQDIKAIVAGSLIDPLFLFYAITAAKGQLLGLVSAAGHGTGVLDTDRLRSLELRSLPLVEQRSIARAIGALDDKIELNRRMNETLEAMARAIFKDWFVDFGPTRAKMQGRAPYLAPDIWSLFPDRLDDEGKPEGWVTSTIGKEVEVVGGSTPSTKEPAFWGGDIAWATPKDLSSLSTPVLLCTERQITESGLSQIGSGLLPVGTVLLSSRAPIGYMAIAQVPVSVNQGFIAMICKKRLSNVFVWLWSQSNMEKVHQNANGSTFQEISKSNFRPIEVIVPAPELLRVFDETARPLFDRIVTNEKENRTLATTRDFLLPKLMSGEVRLKSTEHTSLEGL